MRGVQKHDKKNIEKINLTLVLFRTLTHPPTTGVPDFFFGGPLVQVQVQVVQGASKKKNKEEKNNPGKKQPTDFPLFFFFRCPLRRLWAVCGHATACGTET
jgi:hypothetical protein